MALPNPAPAIGNVLRSRAYCVQGNQTGINVRYWIVSSLTGTGALLSEIATVLSGVLGPLYIACLTVNARYYGLDVAIQSPLPPGPAQSATQAAGPGAVLGASAPLQVSGIATLQTGAIGRAFRGRVYVPFPGVSSQGANNVPLPAYVGNVQALANIYASSDTVVGLNGTTGITPVIYHRKTNSSTPIVAAVARAKWATQRKRGDYGRPNFPPF